MSPEDGIQSRHLFSKKNLNSKRQAHTLNPFRQQDEEAVLAEKSHNRRRWSHVFPLGEIEFKRHAGPNWKSLSQPAILPLTIDYYPRPQELNAFLIRPWDIPLADIDHSQYKSHSDLIMEMIRQRLTQDYQVVPHSVVLESRRRAEVAAQLVAQDRVGAPSPSAAPRIALGKSLICCSSWSIAFTFLPFSSAFSFLLSGQMRLLDAQLTNYRSPTDVTQGSHRGEGEVIEHFLSMGHTIHVLKYDPNAEEKKITVEQLSRRRTQDQPFHYKYLLHSPAMKVRWYRYLSRRNAFSLTSVIILCTTEICEGRSAVS